MCSPILGLWTGIAAIFLPFSVVITKVGPVSELRVLVILAELANGSGLTLEQFLWVAPVLPLLLPVPISAGYLRWLLTGGLAPWAWRTGYALAVLAGVALLSSFGWLAFLVFSEPGSVYAQWRIGRALRTRHIGPRCVVGDAEPTSRPAACAERSNRPAGGVRGRCARASSDCHIGRARGCSRIGHLVRATHRGGWDVEVPSLVRPQGGPNFRRQEHEASHERT